MPLECSGLVIMSRHPIAHVQFRPFTRRGYLLNFDGEVFARKGLASARILFHDLTVDVFTSHFASYRDDPRTNGLVRRRQTLETVAAVAASDADTEFVCNVLVAADHFLVARLKEVCERQLVQLLTLKNAAEMLQFASDYGAGQLARSAMQFLSQNVAAALESRILCSLSDDNVERLTEYYRDSVPGMSKRVIRCGAKSLPNFEVSDAAADSDMTAEDILSEETSIAAGECTAATTAASMSNPGSGGKRRNRRNSSGERRKRSESGSSVMSDSSVKSGGSNSSGTGTLIRFRLEID